MFYRFLGFLLAIFVFLLSKTLRIKVYNRELVDEVKASGEKIVYAFWHQELFVFIDYQRTFDCYKNNPVTVLLSPSRDGDIIDVVLKKNRYSVVRGSARRGGLKSLVKMIRSMKDGSDTAFAVDGPVGPSRIVKPGVVFLAEKAGAVIFPVGSWARHNLKFYNAWDKFMLPLPFSRAVIVFGKPIYMGEISAQDVIVNGTEILQRSLTETSERAKELCGS
ncbi:MAG TPA: lysophospholipid acyltransferase family protein [bacterium]